MAVDYSTLQSPISDLTNYANDIPKLLGLSRDNKAAMLDVKVIYDLVVQGSQGSIPSSWVDDDPNLGNSDEKIPTQAAVKTYVDNHIGSGPQGPQGATGATGPQGVAGAQGARGNTGPQGATGATGPQGSKGADGTGVNILGSLTNVSQLPTSGTSGDAYLVNGVLYVWVGSGGDTQGGKWQSAGNIQGPQGAKGDAGPQGATGAKGDTGPQGAQGLRGLQGAQGDRGAQGATGAAGGTGPTGPQGAKGDTGPQGVKGDTGPQGTSGANVSWANIVSLFAANGIRLVGDTSGANAQIKCAGGFYQEF